MPTSVYDASYITFRNRSKVLYGFNNAINASRNSGSGIVRTEQGTTQMAEVIVVRKQGGCFCATDAAGESATRQGPGACSCSR